MAPIFSTLFVAAGLLAFTSAESTTLAAFGGGGAVVPVPQSANNGEPAQTGAANTQASHTSAARVTAAVQSGGGTSVDPNIFVDPSKRRNLRPASTRSGSRMTAAQRHSTTTSASASATSSGAAAVVNAPMVAGLAAVMAIAGVVV